MSADAAVHCQSCGARNPASAEWCSQCFAPPVPPPTPPPVAAAEPEAEPAASVRPAVTSSRVVADVTLPLVDPSAPLAAPRSVDPDAVGEAIIAGGGRYRRTDEGIDWRCQRCETWNPVELLSCTVCQLPIDGVTKNPGPPPGLDTKEAVRASWLVPGGGQWMLGQRGRAATRGSMCGLWLLGIILFALSADGSARALLPVIVLLVGIAVIWVLSAIDTRTVIAGGSRELLDSRMFLRIVVGVIGGVLLTMVAAAMALK